MADVSGGEWRLGKSYESSGGRVAYEVMGSGEPLVLVHGTPSSSYLWRGVAGRLASNRTVYVYDLPGYGVSEQREGQDVSIGAQTAVLAELLEHWGLEAGYRRPRHRGWYRVAGSSTGWDAFPPHGAGRRGVAVAVDHGF